MKQTGEIFPSIESSRSRSHLADLVFKFCCVVVIASCTSSSSSSSSSLDYVIHYTSLVVFIAVHFICQEIKT